MRISLSLRAFVLWCALTAMLPLAVVAGAMDNEPDGNPLGGSPSTPSIASAQDHASAAPTPPAISAACASAVSASDGRATFIVYFNRGAHGPRPDILAVVNAAAACAASLPGGRRKATISAFADEVGSAARNDALIAERLATLRGLVANAGPEVVLAPASASCVPGCYCRGSAATAGSHAVAENLDCRRGEIVIGG